MQYRNSIVIECKKNKFSILMPMVLSLSVDQLSKYFLCGTKKFVPLLSLRLSNGLFLAVFWIKATIVGNFFKSSCPTSFFNTMIRSYLMSNEKIVELQVGEETNDLFYEAVAIKFLSPKGEKEIRLAIDTPDNMRSYTEEMRKKYFLSQKKDEDNQQ